MTTKTPLLIEHFDIWSAAVTTKATAGRGRNHSLELYGLQKLRALILELAVRGLLVPQDPNDEPASVLLKKSPPIREYEKPFELPKGWEWVKLENVCNQIQDGTHYSPNVQYPDKGSNRFLYITSKNIKNDGVDLSNVTYIDENTHHSIFKRCNPEKGDVLLIKDGAMTGVATINNLDEEFSLLSSVALIKTDRDVLFPPYLKYFLISPSGLQSIIGQMTGSGIPRIILRKIKTSKIPLPPLAEQRRIVAKVDELMALCDQLEQQHDQSIAAHETLVHTLLAALTIARAHGQFADAWARIADHFDLLFTTADSIDQLKHTILQLAVMGKLAPQNPDDEPASVLLKKIAAEKDRLVKAGKIKKQEQLPPIRADEQPFDLPEGWEWAFLGNLSSDIHYGYTASAQPENEGIRLLRITDIQNDRVNWDTVPGCEITDEKSEGYLLENGDVLIARTGGTIGKSYLVENIKFKAVFASYLIRVKRISSMYSPYIKTYLGSSVYWSQLYDNASGTGQPNVNATALKRLLVPIPPLAEQYRIVAKVDELMALCDRLHERLTTSHTTQQQLAEAMTAQARG